MIGKLESKFLIANNSQHCMFLKFLSTVTCVSLDEKKHRRLFMGFKHHIALILMKENSRHDFKWQ